MFFRARTAAANRAATLLARACPGRPGRPGRASANRWRRMDTAGRAVTAIRAESRLPSGSRRSTSGRARSNRRSARPNRLAAVRTRSISSSSESAMGGMRLLRSVGEGDPHPVAPVDVDVLDVRIVDQTLESAHAEQGVEDRLGQRLLVEGIIGHRRWVGPCAGPCRIPARLADDGDARSGMWSDHGDGLPTLLGEAVEVDEDPLTGKLPTMVSGQSGRLWAGQVLGYQPRSSAANVRLTGRACCGVTSGPNASWRLWRVAGSPFDRSRMRHWIRAGTVRSPDTQGSLTPSSAPRALRRRGRNRGFGRP